jgi:uncharacterized membrane protein YqjE
MTQSEKNNALIERANVTRDDLPSLVERLAGNVATLFDQKLALLKVELKEDVNAYVHGSIFILVGGVVAAVGFALVNMALAFAVSTLFAGMDLTQPAKYALAFLVTGLAYLIIGTFVVWIMKNRLARQGIVPRRTMRELERDKEWLKREL